MLEVYHLSMQEFCMKVCWYLFLTSESEILVMNMKERSRNRAVQIDNLVIGVGKLCGKC